MRARFTKARRHAARCAIGAMLAGEDNEGDWPEGVSREELEGALEAIENLDQGCEEGAIARANSRMASKRIA